MSLYVIGCVDISFPLQNNGYFATLAQIRVNSIAINALHLIFNNKVSSEIFMLNSLKEEKKTAGKKHHFKHVIRINSKPFKSAFNHNAGCFHHGKYLLSISSAINL